ncbi:MAG: hypothetical protein Q7S65_03440 [Nanoarchaeota archaeon]|nr:hypothetical protein [Nanoarchaeota archaeon]
MSEPKKEPVKKAPKQVSYADSLQFLPMPRPHLRFKGVWDMQDLYEFMISYFRDRKYKFYERQYKHKVPYPYGYERQQVWQADAIFDETYQWHINVYLHIYDAQDITVKMRDGNVRTFTKGRIWIEFSGRVTIFDDHRWLESPLAAELRSFLNKYIVKKRHQNGMWDVLMYREIQKLVWLTRRRLKMEYDDYEQRHWTGVHG